MHKEIFSEEIEKNSMEIQGKAILCFDENSMQFQGVIHAKDDTQYAVYGTKSGKPKRKCSHSIPDATETDHKGCGCPDELDGPGIPVTYDIKIVDCEVGDEYFLKRVHGRNGENVSLRCKSISFNTTQTYKGQRADMEAQKATGQRLTARRGTVFEGPIEISAIQAVQKNRPWVL